VLQLAAQHLTGLQELHIFGQWRLQQQLQLQHLAPLTMLTSLCIAGQQQLNRPHPFVSVCRTKHQMQQQELQQRCPAVLWL
jgi:hypothetical protein